MTDIRIVDFECHDSANMHRGNQHGRSHHEKEILESSQRRSEQKQSDITSGKQLDEYGGGEDKRSQHHDRTAMHQANYGHSVSYDPEEYHAGHQVPCLGKALRVLVVFVTHEQKEHYRQQQRDTRGDIDQYIQKIQRHTIPYLLHFSVRNCPGATP